MAHLILVHNGLKIGEYGLQKEAVIIIGSDPNCNIHIDAPGVISRHCLVRENDGQFIVLDLASGIGTFLNGERVKEATLLLGDTIDFGEYKIIFVLPGEHPQVFDPDRGLIDLNATMEEQRTDAQGHIWHITW